METQVDATKVCARCNRRKPIDMFYRQPKALDGHQGKCKSCTKKAVRARYVAAIDRIREYERERSKDPERKVKAAEYLRQRRARHPGKARARNAVSNALQRGLLARQPCAHCGTTMKVQAHHHDYRKPLDVEWLCFKCHREHAHGQKVAA